MNKTEQLGTLAGKLSDEQLDTLISLAQSMAGPPFLDQAPPEAIGSLERGLAQFGRGETIPFDKAMERLRKAASALKS